MKEGLMGLAGVLLLTAGLTMGTVACRRPVSPSAGEAPGPFTTLATDRFGHHRLVRVEATGECFFVIDRGSGVAVSPARCTR